MRAGPDLLEAVRRLYAAIERFDSAAARALKLDRTALRAVNAMERGIVSPGQLGAELGLSSGSVTALLDRLERADHVHRTLSKDDGRRRDAQLTDHTRHAADALYRRLGASIHEAFLSANDETLATLVTNLITLADAFAAAAPDQSNEV
jgi:DNA-binding MarR family transcriptional regulator